MIYKTHDFRGFTLLELMITVAIVAILAAIALPSYTNQIRRAHRSEGTAALLTIQTAQEKAYLQYGRYAASTAELNNPPVGGWGGTPGLNTPATTTSGYYTLSITSNSGGASDYTATATAAGSQANDTKCATLTVDSTGQKKSYDSSSALTTECWTR